MATYRIFNIAYDAPTEVREELAEEIFISTGDFDIDPDACFDEQVANILSDGTGWCVNHFDFEEVAQ